MKSQFAIQEQKKDLIPSTHAAWQHSAVKAVADQFAQPDQALPNMVESQPGHDFSQLPVSTASTIQSFSTCTISPRRCPFGGACHTCPTRVQAKLTISQPDDEYEREADRVAETVMRMPEPQKEEEPYRQPGCAHVLQRRAVDAGTPDQVPPVVYEVLHSPGRPLDVETRAFMESRFEQDFGDVRIHTDAKAVESARVVNALAYTVGRDIVFGAEQCRPRTLDDRRLIAHELTHVVQQKAASPSRGPMLDRLHDLLQRREYKWPKGGLLLDGSNDFIAKVEADLDTLYTTPNGKELLDELTNYYGKFYRSNLRINEADACGWQGMSFLWHPTGCPPPNRCETGAPDWSSRAKSYVYLHHELIHVYLDKIAGKGTHKDKECMATGLGPYFSTEPYSENRLRCQLGLPARPCYIGPDKDYCPGLSASCSHGITSSPTMNKLQRTTASVEPVNTVLPVVMGQFITPLGAGGGLGGLTSRDRGRRGHSCVPRCDFPCNRTGIIFSSGLVFERFNMHIDWDDKEPDCNCNCGQYRQYVKGHVKVNGQKIPHKLWDGVDLEEGNYKEDGEYDEKNKRNISRYGHRGDLETSDDKFIPNRTTGCSYRGKDEPGVPDVPPGAYLDMAFYFKGQTYDDCQKVEGEERKWEVKFNGTVPGSSISNYGTPI